MAHHPLLKPHCLAPGDTIGIVALSSPFNHDAFEQGIAVLHEMGFATHVAPGAFDTHGYLAGTDAQRIAQLHNMLADDQVKGIVCARGGYGTLRILADVDYDLCRKHAKPFIGFSDITALHLALHQHAGWVTFHGPMVTTLARSDAVTRQAFYDTLTDQIPSHLDLNQARRLFSGTAEGRLMGGNLATLCHMVGTPRAGNFSGAILLLEDIGEAPYRIDRMLTQMTLAGVFDGLAGLMLGTFENCGRSDDLDSLMKAHFEPMGIPVVTGAAIGHAGCNLTLPLGIKARLDADRVTLEYLESVFDG